jgi:hypothetical protein
VGYNPEIANISAAMVRERRKALAGLAAVYAAPSR